MDDRVFYHQSKSLIKSDYQVTIISTKEELNTEIDGIIIRSYDDQGLSQKEKLAKMVRHLSQSIPDAIICDSPLAVIASGIFKKKRNVQIIYDITEWYPSKKNLSDSRGIRRIIKSVILTAVNLFSGLKTDRFIFGEHYKSLLFRYFFFWKPFIYLPYYPDLNYIQHYPLRELDNEINFFYSGLVNADKGINSILDTIRITARSFPAIQFNLNIIGYFASTEEKNNFEQDLQFLEQNIHVSIRDRVPFLDFCKQIGNTDLFLDLREKDFENTHCLPIKLFYYLACGRPVIYSDLRSIQHEIKEFNFGYISDPSAAGLIAKQISSYITKPEIYKLHAMNALTAAKTTYNWENIEKEFISFITRN